MNARELLLETRRLIAAGWTQNVFCRDSEGRSVPYGGDKACEFCLSGAARHAAVKAGYSGEVVAGSPLGTCIEAMKAALPPGWPLAPWNDERGRKKEEVLELVDKAIELLDKGRVEV